MLLLIVWLKGASTGLFFGLALGVWIQRRHQRRVELARVWRPGRQHYAAWGGE